MKTEIKPEIPKYRLTDPGCIKRQKIADMKTRIQMLKMQPKTPQGLEEIKILQNSLWLFRQNKFDSSFFQYIPSRAPNRSQLRVKTKFPVTNMTKKKKKR